MVPSRPNTSLRDVAAPVFWAKQYVCLIPYSNSGYVVHHTDSAFICASSGYIILYVFLPIWGYSAPSGCSFSCASHPIGPLNPLELTAPGDKTVPTALLAILFNVPHIGLNLCPLGTTPGPASHTGFYTCHVGTPIVGPVPLVHPNTPMTTTC
jgi:hypothetical protein